MTETKDRQLDRRDHLEVVAGSHHRLEGARTCKIAFNRFAQPIEARAFYPHPPFERPETPRQFRPVVPAYKRLVCFLTKHPGVIRLMSKSGPGNLGIAVNYAADVHWEIKPFVRIQRD